MPSSTDSIPWMTIIIVVVVLVILMIIIVAIYKYQVYLDKNEPMLLASVYSAHDVPSIKKNAPISETGQEYTYNFWMKIKDYDKGYNHMKHVLTRSSHDPTKIASRDTGLCNPTIWLYPETNDLAVRVSTMMPSTSMRKKMNPTLFPHYEGVKDGASGVEYTNVNPDYYFRGTCNNDTTNCEFVQTTVACDVANIPLQRWVMVTVCLWNRTLDVYINGYLVRSVVLPGPALFDPDALKSIYVGGSGPTDTFGGHFSRLKYYNRAITAQEVMALYKKGPVPAAYWWKTVKHNIEITLDANQDS